MPKVKLGRDPGQEHTADIAKIIKHHNTFCSEMQDPHIGRGGGDPPMTGLELFFVVLGVCSATSGLFRVIDRIEGK